MKALIKLVMVVILLGSLASIAQASDWKFLGKSDPNSAEKECRVFSELFYDIQSVTQAQNRVVKATIRMNLSEEGKKEYAPTSFIVESYECDCSNKKYRTSNLILYKNEFTVMKSTKEPGDLSTKESNEWRTINPGTPPDLVMKTLCKTEVILVHEIEDWRFIAKPEKSSFYYDAKSIRQTPENFIRVSLKMYRTEQGSSYMIVQGEYDCVNRKSRMLNSISYSKEGAVLNTDNRVDEWSPIIPGTLQDIVIRKICK